jgi:hypothetical protein
MNRGQDRNVPTRLSTMIIWIVTPRAELSYERLPRSASIERMLSTPLQ